MIFKEKIFEKEDVIRPEMQRLLELANENQNHNGDLLLWHVNGFYDESILGFKGRNPHVVGPGYEGQSEHTHYKFIHEYRTNNISSITLEEYLDKIEFQKGGYTKEQERLKFEEEISVQSEMLIYLKFWESDIIIKRLYQLVRLLNGEPYDWHFKLSSNPKEKETTIARHEAIRLLIRDKIEKHSPVIAKLVRDTYKTQIRNAIAHSNYWIVNRRIGLTNYVKKDKFSQLRNISFDEWIDIFHNTLILHNELIRLGILINEVYAKNVAPFSNVMPVLITEKNGKQYELPLEYRAEFKDWSYKQS